MLAYKNHEWKVDNTFLKDGFTVIYD